jgi:hypothetical protein
MYGGGRVVWCMCAAFDVEKATKYDATVVYVVVNSAARYISVQGLVNDACMLRWRSWANMWM